MTRKNVKLEISNDQATEIYSDLLGKSGEFAGLWFTGSLMDEFAIVMADNQDWQIKMGKGRPILARKYVYTREEYVNCWTSRLILTLTDNKDEFLDFIKSRFEQDDDLDEIDFDEFRWECGLDD